MPIPGCASAAARMAPNGTEWSPPTTPTSLPAWRSRARLVVHPVVHPLAQRVDGRRSPARARSLPSEPPASITGRRPRRASSLQRAHLGRDRQHRDPALVRPARLAVEEVHLAAGLEHGRGAVGGAGAVRHRRLPGHGHDDDHRRSSGVDGQAVQAAAGGGRAGIETAGSGM